MASESICVYFIPAEQSFLNGKKKKEKHAMNVFLLLEATGWEIKIKMTNV